MSNSPRAALLDETSRPPLRVVLGGSLARCSDASFAIRRVRLAGIDLSPAELGPLRTCRVLIGRLDAGSLHDVPAGAEARGPALERLLHFAASGRLAVRSAPTTGWNPDFSVLQGVAGANGAAPSDLCIVGCHYFYEPDPPDGPALTTILTAPASVQLALRRFDTLWESAYDVLPAVAHALERLLSIVGP
jgi:hypothetical protein